MPKRPQGQKRPGGVLGAAVTVAKIATGEIADSPTPAPTIRNGIALLPLREGAPPIILELVNRLRDELP